MNNITRVMVMFDLPRDTNQERKVATRLRNYLIKEGFFMLQYSVYCRICHSPENAKMYMDKVAVSAPHNGCMRIFTMTENQYEKMILIGQEPQNEKLLKETLLVV